MISFSRDTDFLMVCSKYFGILFFTVSIKLLCKPNMCKTHSFDRLSVQLTLRTRLLAFISNAHTHTNTRFSSFFVVQPSQPYRASFDTTTEWLNVAQRRKLVTQLLRFLAHWVRSFPSVQHLSSITVSVAIRILQWYVLQSKSRNRLGQAIIV